MLTAKGPGQCAPQRGCDDRVDPEQEDALARHAALASARHDSAQTSDSAQSAGDDCYDVVWTVFIALAFPREEEVGVPEAADKVLKTNRDIYSNLVKKAKKDSSSQQFKTPKRDSPVHLIRPKKPQGFYRIEYNLMPGDADTVKVDLALYGPIAKVLAEEKLTIVKTWHEGGVTWVGWTQSFSVRVSRDVLISLSAHKITVQICKIDKQTGLARPERPKAFQRLLDQVEASDKEGTVKTMVSKLRSLCGQEVNTSHIHRWDGFSSSEPGVRSGTGFRKPLNDGLDLKDKSDTVCAEINLIRLLAGEMSLTDRLPLRSRVAHEVMANISLDRPLISDQIKSELNPLVISILSASSMPSSPLPFHVLEEKCVPVYCQYKFHSLNVHRTNYQKHSSDICFGDVNVILAGLMEPKELIEFLSGPPMAIEVHDRDSKLDGALHAKFDSELYDDLQSFRAPRKQTAVHHSHGVASLDLSELLRGKRELTLHLPIKCCSPPQPSDWGRRAWARQLSDAAANNAEPMQAGHYLKANSELKVSVEIACPISTESCEGQFGRIVYLFGYRNFPVMTALRTEIININAAAFQLRRCSLETTERALSNYTTSFKLEKGKDLDFVTGFHVADKRRHIVVLEGLKHEAIRRLWEAVPIKLSEREEEQVIVLYNSSLVFYNRIYDSQDLTLSPIFLLDSLESIMSQPLIYVRGTVSPPCFQALSRLSHLCQVRELKDMVRYDLFLSPDMIASMREECSTYVPHCEPDTYENAQVEAPSRRVRAKRHPPLDAHNMEYLKWRRRVQKAPPSRDFVQENLKKVREDSERLQKPETAFITVEPTEPEHMYSTQTFSIHEKAMEALHKEMAKMPGRRFTFSQQYLSATVEHWEPRPLKRESRSAPMRFRSMSRECIEHPKKPDEARLEDLRKPWRENLLHANTLEPTLSRDRWTWSKRHEDFQLYFRSRPFFNPPILSILLAGDHLEKEQLDAERAYYNSWLKKLLFPGSNADLEFKCHMKGNEGRIQSILKDEPMKYSLQKPGLALEPYPQVFVMNEGEYRSEGDGVILAPGPCMESTLSSKNTIPRHVSRDEPQQMCFGKQSSFLYKRTTLHGTDEADTSQGDWTNVKTDAPTFQPVRTIQPFKNIMPVRTNQDSTLFNMLSGNETRG